MGREKKFIVLENCYNNKLNFKIGYPIYHKDLIDKSDEKEGWKCIGGGFWDLNVRNKTIDLFGSSSDFGKVDRDKLKMALNSMDKHKWWHFGWLCERLYEEQFPDIDYDNLDKEFKFTFSEFY